ncbi:PepSY domain-containing protein [Siphonobacter sp. BAB-5385]|uniref:PepSY domain-containing protein n=1 Tax=Siphonobacter sp. BAB-5385 TaxID=1864822 RepID=UPI001C3D817E|nr:PepSY domain-containing protein [Siphonobacter sp. BAB-5385]
MKTVIKAIRLVHRYLGFALSLLFLVWFLSGLMMMYVSYPTLKSHQKLQQTPPIDLTTCLLTPAEAITRAGVTDSIKSIRLGMVLNRPVYRIVTLQNRQLSIYADNPAILPYASESFARQLAQHWSHAGVQQVEKLTEIDQWMAAHRSQGYLPEVYRMQMGNEAGTYVYVSPFSNEVVQQVTARQRLLAWLGPIPHWIYPTFLIRNRPVWSQIVIWVSIIGTLMCLAGLAMGFIRYQRKRPESLAFSPYKKRWFRWHHYTGFIFGLFAFTWVLSGLFSMSPFNWTPSARLSSQATERWMGGPLNLTLFKVSPAAAYQKLSRELVLKEIQLIQWNGRPYYLALQDDHHTRVLAADEVEANPFQTFETQAIEEAIRKLEPKVAVLESKVLDRYDAYYYAKNGEKRLPVLRTKLDTPEQIWYYVDLKTSQVVSKHQTLTRVERWLYHGLHSLDFDFLLNRRPLWDITLIVLLLGGTATSSTGLVLTWQWLRRKKAMKRKQTTVRKGAIQPVSERLK